MRGTGEAPRLCFGSLVWWNRAPFEEETWKSKQWQKWLSRWGRFYLLSGSCRLTNITLFPQTSNEMSRCTCEEKNFHQHWKKSWELSKFLVLCSPPALSSWISERGKSLIKSLSAHKKSLGESWLAEQLISLKLSKIKIHGRHQCRVAEEPT